MINSYTTNPTDAERAAADSITAHAVEHADGCPNGRPGWPDTSITAPAAGCLEKCRTGYIVTTYTGRVVSLREMNGYDDSDFYARVIKADGTTAEICYASTRGWTYFNGATVDAPAADLEKVAAADEAAARERAEMFAANRAAVEATIPRDGREVRVKSKRSKVAHGTTGRVFYFGVSQYANTYPSRYTNPRAAMVDGLTAELREFKSNPGAFRVGFQTAAGETFYCSASCVEVIA